MSAEPLAFVAWPLAVVSEQRNRHQLPYSNQREYDYAFARTKVIPLVLTEWAYGGINVSGQYVKQFWERHADKRGVHHRNGELYRCAKLVLDTLRAAWDIAAFGECGVQVLYSPINDMAGRDLCLLIPNVGRVWVQLSVKVDNRDFKPMKQLRRVGRGEGEVEGVAQLVAMGRECDRQRQPWVPPLSWYQRQVEELQAVHTAGSFDAPFART